MSDPTSAYLGPKLWEKQIPFSLDFEDMNQMNDVMDMEVRSTPLYLGGGYGSRVFHESDVLTPYR